MLACTELCRSAAHMMLTAAPQHHLTCKACAEICEACAKSCDEVGDMEDCVEACRRCAETCREMAAEVGDISTPVVHSRITDVAMAIPVTSVRSLPEHAPLIRRVAAALRDDPLAAARIRAALEGQPATDGTGGQHNYGPFGTERQALAVLRDRLVATLDPLAIYLFGSRGRGQGRPDSDFDLLVVLPDEAGEAALDPGAAYAPVMGLGIGVDVVPCLASDLAAEHDIPGTLVHEAMRGGRLIYERKP